MATPDHDYETLNFHKATETVDETDVYEHIPQTEILPDPVDSPCHLRYINGGIYYGSRILLPAKLSFMKPNCQAPPLAAADDESDELLTSPTSSSSSSTAAPLPPPPLPYRCVHGIKKYGDMKLKEQQRIHLDNEANAAAGHCSNDESDRIDDDVEKLSSEYCRLPTQPTHYVLNVIRFFKT